MDNTDIHNETSAHTAHKLREKASGVSSELIVLTAHVVSSLYSPFYLPVVAFVVLFLFSYLNMLPMQTKVILTLIVYFFTILLPHVAIYPPLFIFCLFTDTKSLKNIFIYNKAQTFTSSGFAFPQKICIFAENFFKYGKDTNKI